MEITTLLLAIVPPVITGIFAYVIAVHKSNLNNKINKAAVEATIQERALIIIKDVMHDMREEFNKEMSLLREENKVLKSTLDSTQKKIQELTAQCSINDKTIEVLNHQIIALQTTVKLYESEINYLKRGT